MYYACLNTFFVRIVNGEKEKISKTLYDILYQLDLCDVYHSKWLNCVKDILNKCGFITIASNNCNTISIGKDNFLAFLNT
jgi:hypothetical protein